MRIRIKKRIEFGLPLVYILTMATAYTRYIGNLSIGNSVQYGVGLLWIIVAITYHVSRKNSYSNEIFTDCTWLFDIYFVPHLLLHLYSFILMIFGMVDLKYINLNLSVYIPTLCAICSFYIFRRKALKYNIIAVALSWFISFLASIATWGLDAIKGAIIQAYFFDKAWILGYSKNHLEFHDLALAVGYFFVFYIYCREDKINCTKPRLLFFIIISFLSLKKVMVLGVIVAWIFYLIINKVKKISKVKICLFAGWILFFICILFIFDLYITNLFYYLIDKYGINTMNRTLFYQMITERTKFSLFFLGIGRNTVAQLFQRELYWDKGDLSLIGAVHCDILKMYVENGFVLFVIWLWYKLIFMTSAFRRRFGQNVAVFYFGSVIYTFVLYFTDNTEVYFTCQMLSILTVMTYATKEKYGFKEQILLGKTGKSRKNKLRIRYTNIV